MANYILNAKKQPVICHDLREFGQWFEGKGNRQIDHTQIGAYRISTIFLGIDHNFRNTGKPILFETMVFNDFDSEMHTHMDRYRTYKTALSGHKKIVDMIETRIETFNKIHDDMVHTIEELKKDYDKEELYAASIGALLERVALIKRMVGETDE